jgi:hypothetical protein
MTLSSSSDVDVPAIDDASSTFSLPSWTMTRRCMSCASDMSGWAEADSDDADGAATFFFFFGLAAAFLADAVAVVVADLFSSISIVGAIIGCLKSVFRCLPRYLGRLFQSSSLSLVGVFLDASMLCGCLCRYLRAKNIAPRKTRTPSNQ